MSKIRSLFCINCAIILLGFGIAFSQTEPATTEPAAGGSTADEPKKELNGDISKAATETVPATGAKVYSDGKTVFVNSKVLFKLTATDDLAVDKIEYRIDDGPVSTYESPFSLDKEGPHSIKYYGLDKMGNKEAEKSYSVVVDNTGPVITITASAPVRKIGDTVYFTKNASFNITSVDALSGVSKVEYSTDGTSYQEYAAAFSIPASGAINFKVRSIDNVGNITEQFAFRAFDENGKEVELKDLTAKLSVDDKAPAVSIKPDKELKQINGQNAASTDVKYTIEAKDEESGVAAVEYRLDGKGDFVPYTGEIQFLNNGKHQIDARATDRMGNISPIASFTVYVDILPPKSEIEAADK